MFYMLMAINQIYEVHADGMHIIWLYINMVIYQRNSVSWAKHVDTIANATKYFFIFLM